MILDTSVKDGAQAAANADAWAVARCALLTPPGPGAVAAIRVCGPAAWDAVRSYLRDRAGDPPKHIRAGRLWFGQFCDAAEALDDVIVGAWPHSKSGAVVDITCHGGVRIVERILLALTRQGVAVVQAGELSDASVRGQGAVQRDVEEVLPLCSTVRGTRFVLGQRALLTAELHRIADLLEGGCDDQARVAIQTLLHRGRIWGALLDPPSIALVGPVNAGKSSLANRLAGREHAIVSDRAGTTRDWVTIDATLDGVPVTLVDTPGRAAQPGELEQEAIHRAERLARKARIRVLVLDATRTVGVHPGDWLDQPDHPVAITVFNKLDKASPPAAMVEGLAARTRVVQASALTGEGVSAVRAAVTRSLGFEEGIDHLPAAFGPIIRAGLEGVLAAAAWPQAAAVAEIRRLAGMAGV